MIKCTLKPVMPVSRRTCIVVRCDTGRTEKIREVRKDLLEIRRTYEEKRMATFKTLFESVKAIAENESLLVKELINKVVCEPHVAKKDDKTKDDEMPSESV